MRNDLNVRIIVFVIYFIYVYTHYPFISILFVIFLAIIEYFFSHEIFTCNVLCYSVVTCVQILSY